MGSGALAKMRRSEVGNSVPFRGTVPSSMASPSLVLPGVLFVGEDDRARMVAHTGPAAGWHVPRGILGWSTEVSVLGRDALTEEIRRATKIVMPEEQIPPAKMPLTSQAAHKSPLVAVSG